MRRDSGRCHPAWPGVVTALLLLSGCAQTFKGPTTGAECNRIMALASSGEHKAAVDDYEKLKAGGSSCGGEVEDAVSRSKSKLEAADSLVRKAFRQRAVGDLSGAKNSLNQALKVYPRYYWVSNLLRGLDSSVQLRVEGLRQEAQFLETLGDFSDSLARIRQARDLLPNDVLLKEEEKRLEALVKLQIRKDSAQRELDKAVECLDQDRLTDAEKVVEKSEAPSLLPTESRSLLEQIHARRQLKGKAAYHLARSAEAAGYLDKTFNYVRAAFDHGKLDEPLESDIIDLAKSLGMKYYSQGNLTQARDVWSFALIHDPDNTKLKEYLTEVRARLENLKRIQQGGGK